MPYSHKFVYYTLKEIGLKPQQARYVWDVDVDYTLKEIGLKPQRFTYH